MQTPIHLPRVLVSRYHPGERHHPHEHDVCNVSLVLAGTLEEWVGSRHEQAGPLSVVVKPAGTRHADQFGPDGATIAQIHVHAELTARMDDGERAVAEWRWLHDGRVARSFLRLVRLHHPRTRSASLLPPEENDSELVELLAAIDAPVAGAASPPPRWLAIIRECVDETWDAPPSVRALAREAGVHPVYLAREFRRWYGCSITTRVKRHRLRAAAAMLAGSGAAISHVALSTGFADQSHLTRVFSAELGTTPGRFRALAGAV